eukprot:Sspe_Gene.75775::Locus_47343_Transcript_1_1_Confidence_1.000_Length_2124::g.75775::m.75775/K03098/APOD; apolipoprotein D and lipocalin family protein
MTTTRRIPSLRARPLVDSYTMHRFLAFAIAAAAMSVVAGECSKTAEPVRPFNLTNYLGLWYEIGDTASFAGKFEKELRCITANYSLSGDGMIRVLNSGIKHDGSTRSVVGKARQKEPQSGALEASFFGPFYAPYTVIKLIEDSRGGYRAALVWSCSDKIVTVEDVWVLSRTRTISAADYTTLLDYAIAHDIDLKKLKFGMTNQTNCP